MAHWFFSKLIFTKCQLTIIIKIHKLLHIHSFYFTFIANQVAQRQMGELVSQGSQVLISLMTIFFFSKIILKKKNLKIMKMKKKKLKKKKNQDFFWRSEKRDLENWSSIWRIIHAAPSVGRNHKVNIHHIKYSKVIFKIFESDLQKDIFWGKMFIEYMVKIVLKIW